MSLRVDDLRVYYRTLAGEIRALDGLSLEIADGEIMGLAGESGCGKSTFGNSLVRLDGRMRHVGGTVALDGVDLPIGDADAMRDFRFREVSIVPQYAMSALNPTRRIGTMIDELLASRGARTPEVRAELHRRLALVGLEEDVLERYPIELSGGMKQRLVMVISTLLDPSLLVADEITSALDVASQRAVAETLVEFRDRGYVRSMIVVTHDVSILVQIADSLAIMYAGRLAEKAPTSELMARPLHPYTRMLIGSLPEMGVRFGERRLAGIAGTPPSLLNPPEGCRFRARCPLAGARCSEQPPVAHRRAGPHRGVLGGRRLMLTLERVSKAYRVGAFGGRRQLAVRDVSFAVAPGEVVSLIGESGSGKTTIGRMILRLLSVTAGRITLDATDVATLRGATLRDYYRTVQGVFQDPFSSFNPIFKVDHAFALGRGLVPRDVADSEWQARVEAALRGVGLSPAQVLHKYPHQLSGGQLQRVLVARALALDVRLLVADEIISMLDASTRIDVLNLLGDLKARGLGILFISHDLSLANYISERAVILQRGRVVELGPTEAVFGNPLHPYTRMLLASVPRLDERWSREAAPAARADARCRYHEALATSGIAGEPPLLIEQEPGHLVGCADPDGPCRGAGTATTAAA